MSIVGEVGQVADDEADRLRARIEAASTVSKTCSALK
jgi:hypothetical protein